MGGMYLIFVLLVAMVGAAVGAEIASCPSGTVMHWANARFTPCWELIDKQEKIDRCRLNRYCNFGDISSSVCKTYFSSHSSYLWTCVPEDEDFLPTLSSEPTTQSFRDSFEICEGNDDYALMVENLIDDGAKRNDQFKRPTIAKKNMTRQIMHEIKAGHWDNVKILADGIGSRVCRRVGEDDEDIFFILPPVGKWAYSGILLMYRPDATSPIVMDAAHGNEDQDTGEQATKVFQKTKKLMASVFAGYHRESSSTKDPCQTGSRITDNAHSMENPFFHAVVGLADAFPDSVFIEPHRCASCGAMRIGRALNGRASKADDFIRTFAKAASDQIYPRVSWTAKQKGWYTTTWGGAVSDTVFDRTTGNNFFSRTDVNGKYLQNVFNLCKGEGKDVDDTMRFLHIEQQGGYVIKASTAFALAIEQLSESTFMSTRSV